MKTPKSKMQKESENRIIDIINKSPKINFNKAWKEVQEERNKER